MRKHMCKPDVSRYKGAFCKVPFVLGRQSGMGLVEIIIGLAITAGVAVTASKFFVFANKALTAEQQSVALGQIQDQFDSIFRSSIDHIELNIKRLDKKGHLSQCLNSAASRSSVAGCTINAALPVEIRLTGLDQPLSGTVENPVAYTSQGAPCEAKSPKCGILVYSDFVPGCLEQAPGTCVIPEVLVFRVYLTTKSSLKGEKRYKTLTYLRKIGKVEDPLKGTLVCGAEDPVTAIKQFGKAIRGFKGGKIECF